jgi:hypothetical protein
MECVSSIVLWVTVRLSNLKPEEHSSFWVTFLYFFFSAWSVSLVHSSIWWAVFLSVRSMSSFLSPKKSAAASLFSFSRLLPPCLQMKVYYLNMVWESEIEKMALYFFPKRIIVLLKSSLVSNCFPMPNVLLKKASMLSRITLVWENTVEFI